MSAKMSGAGEDGGFDGGAGTPEARAVLTIDLGALRSNYRELARMAAPADCAAVVKADAYGLGLEPVAKALRAEGCTTYFVASLAEARQLRMILPEAVIYVMDGLLPGCAASLSAIDARPALGSLEEIEEWSAYCADAGVARAAAIHIDTGMNRLGLPPGDVKILAAKPGILDAFELSLVMSHLVAGEEPDNPKAEAQANLFDELRALLPPARAAPARAAPASLSNSAGTQRAARFRYDLVRPGIALYGGHVIAGAPNPMRPVIKLEARILQVRDLKAGETIGYNATFTAERPMRVATLATGYADGFLRAGSASNDDPELPAYIGGHKAPLVGRISMDLIGLDVTGVPSAVARRGAMAELIGERVTIDDIARRAGTISYEVLTRLGDRTVRVYQG